MAVDQRTAETAIPERDWLPRPAHAPCSFTCLSVAAQYLRHVTARCLPSPCRVRRVSSVVRLALNQVVSGEALAGTEIPRGMGSAGWAVAVGRWGVGRGGGWRAMVVRRDVRRDGGGGGGGGGAKRKKDDTNATSSTPEWSAFR